MIILLFICLITSSAAAMETGNPGLLPVTLSMDERKTTRPPPTPPSRPKIALPRKCRKKTCRVAVEGYSDSAYVYGRLEIHRGKEAKGFLYLPEKQIYVYGRVVNTHSILAKDAKGNLYRLVPVKNNHPYKNRNPMRKSKDFRY